MRGLQMPLAQRLDQVQLFALDKNQVLEALKQ
jgi:hypothetical protein